MAEPTGNQLANTLKTLFQTEGPESGGTYFEIPSFESSPGGRLDMFKQIGEKFSPVIKQNPSKSGIYQGIVDDINKRTEGADGLGIFLDDPFKSSELEFAKREIIKNAGLEDLANSNLYPKGSEGMSLTKKKILEDQASRIENMPNNSAAFDESGLDQIAATLAEAQKPSFFNAGDAMSAGQAGALESSLLDSSTLDSSTSTGPDDGLRGEKSKVLGSQENLDDGFSAAWQDAQSILGIDASPKENESKKDALERYKKEFSEATGIDVSGKVDKSRALMSFGLALMQNKAGKGFNVGKLLKETAVAGEKALPALDKATADAKAGQLAAGKYALNQRKADINAEKASAAAAGDFKKQVYLKWYDSQLEREESNLKAAQDLLKAQAEGGGEYDKKHEFTFATGQGDASTWKIPVVYDKKSPNSGVILKPDAFARKYIDGRAGVDDAIEIIDVMRDASRDIAQGGGTARFAFDKLNSIGKALFPKFNTGNPSSEQEYAQGVNLLMGRFKRFLTQETGNGISNRDVEIWENEIMKKPGWFTNFDETNSALNQLEDIFRSKMNEFDAGIDFIYNPANLKTGDYERLIDKYGSVDQILGQTGKLVFQDGKIVRVK